MTARWWCRVCRAKGHDGPAGAAAHMDEAHYPTDDDRRSATVSFGFTGYKPYDRHHSPARTPGWA